MGVAVCDHQKECACERAGSVQETPPPPHLTLRASSQLRPITHPVPRPHPTPFLTPHLLIWKTGVLAVQNGPQRLGGVGSGDGVEGDGGSLGRLQHRHQVLLERQGRHGGV